MSAASPPERPGSGATGTGGGASSITSSAAGTEVSLRQFNAAPQPASSMPPPAAAALPQRLSGTGATTSGAAGQQPQQQTFRPELSSQAGRAGTSSAAGSDGPPGAQAPPLLQSNQEPVNPRESRLARRRLELGAGGGAAPSLQSSMLQSPARSVGPSMRSSDQHYGGRLAARALARGSVRDSGSERSSKAVKDVYRDDRGRRVERPKVVKSDVHVIGELVGATDFPLAHPALSCRWRLVYEGVKSWAVVRGAEQGCTHVCSAAGRDDAFVAWEHPIDVHLTTQKLEGWPSLLLMVYSRDDAARKDTFLSYALCPLPNTPGPHHLTLRTWYPVEAHKLNSRNVFAHYLGMAPRLDDDLADLGYATDVTKRQESGPYIASVGAGCVHLRLQMLFRELGGLTRQMGDNLYKSLERFQFNLEEARKSEMRQSAMAEHMANKKGGAMSAGLKQVRERRTSLFEQAQKNIDRRRSLTPSHEGSFRAQSVDRERPGAEQGAGASERVSGTQSAPRPARPDPAAATSRAPGGPGGPSPGASAAALPSPGAASTSAASDAGPSGQLQADRQAERDQRRLRQQQQQPLAP